MTCRSHVWNNLVVARRNDGGKYEVMGEGGRRRIVPNMKKHQNDIKQWMPVPTCLSNEIDKTQHSTKPTKHSKKHTLVSRMDFFLLLPNVQSAKPHPTHGAMDMQPTEVQQPFEQTKIQFELHGCVHHFLWTAL